MSNASANQELSNHLQSTFFISLSLIVVLDMVARELIFSAGPTKTCRSEILLNTICSFKKHQCLDLISDNLRVAFHHASKT